jgi:hypothetical protein
MQAKRGGVAAAGGGLQRMDDDRLTTKLIIVQTSTPRVLGTSTIHGARAKFETQSAIDCVCLFLFSRLPFRANAIKKDASDTVGVIMTYCGVETEIRK